MNYENRVIWVKQVNDLEKSSTYFLAPDQQFVITDLLREWGLRTSHNCFRFFGTYSMFGDMFSIPIDPAKLHCNFPIMVLILPGGTK
jgi:hypothetical protein